MKILNKYKKYKRDKKLSNLKKKYRGLYLTSLVLISVILNNYNTVILNNKVNEEEMLSYYLSTSYFYNEEKKFIYVMDDSDDVIKKKINISSSFEIEGDYLKLYSWSELLDQIFLVRLDLSNYSVNNKTITLNKKISYLDFINGVISNGTCEVYNSNGNKVSSGNMMSGMTLKLYHEGILLDTYNVVVDIYEYTDYKNLNIKNNIVYLDNFISVSELVNLIDTNGIVRVLDKEGNVLNNNEIVKTCSKLEIEHSQSMDELFISVKGDVTGSGDIFIGDVSKLYQYYMKTIYMDSCYVTAGDINNDDKIDSEDISRLYQYFMGELDGLN